MARMGTVSSSPAAAPAGPGTSASGANYALGLLTAIYALNFLDRNVINILLDPIKRDLGLSDTTLGLLSGFAFVLFYTVLGMPIARWADRGSRRSIMFLGLLLWSATTAASGLAQNAVHLALARFGVGVGEAAGTAPAHSIIADLFPKNRRPWALGIYSSGVYLGIFLGYFVGGWVNQYYGWRAAFMVAGAPGILLALVLRLTVTDPVRGASEDRAVAAAAPAPLWQTLGFLLRQRTYLLVVIGFGLTSFTNYSFTTWIPAFLRRIHHLSSAEIGTYAGTVKGLLGIAATLLGGYVVQQISRTDDRWKLLAPAIATLLAVPALILMAQSGTVATALAGLAVGTLLIGFHLGPVFAVAQTVARVSMRSFASAAMLLVANLVGLGLGPAAVGFLNDILAARYGEAAIRYSLTIAALVSVAGAGLFWAASRSITADTERALQPQAFGRPA